MDLKLQFGFLWPNYGKYIIDLCLKHPGGEINFIHIFNKTECHTNIFPPFQTFLSQSILISIIVFWHTQIKPIQGIITWLPLAPSVSKWSNWRAFFSFFLHILHINIGVLKLKSLSILGDCFLMASHYSDVGYGSNENVIRGLAEAVQRGVFSDRDKRLFTV